MNFFGFYLIFFIFLVLFFYYSIFRYRHVQTFYYISICFPRKFAADCATFCSTSDIFVFSSFDNNITLPIASPSDIIGYITRGRGVSIHRCDCPSMGHSPEDLERMIEVSWDGSSGESFHVGIDIQAYDRAGILMEVMAVLSELKITITNINAKVQEDTKNVSINLVVDIRDISQLDFVMTKLRRIREVYTVQRSKGGA